MGTFTNDYAVPEDQAPVDRSSLRVLVYWKHLSALGGSKLPGGNSGVIH